MGDLRAGPPGSRALRAAAPCTLPGIPTCSTTSRPSAGSSWPATDGLPVFLLGHSMGGQIALAYALDHQDDLPGLVLSAPALASDAVPKAALPVLRLLGKVGPTPATGGDRLDADQQGPGRRGRVQGRSARLPGQPDAGPVDGAVRADGPAARAGTRAAAATAAHARHPRRAHRPGREPPAGVDERVARPDRAAGTTASGTRSSTNPSGTAHSPTCGRGSPPTVSAPARARK